MAQQIFSEMRDQVNNVVPRRDRLSELVPGDVIRLHRVRFPGEHNALRRRMYQFRAAAGIAFLAGLACMIRLG